MLLMLLTDATLTNHVRLEFTNNLQIIYIKWISKLPELVKSVHFAHEQKSPYNRLNISTCMR